MADDFSSATNGGHNLETSMIIDGRFYGSAGNRYVEQFLFTTGDVDADHPYGRGRYGDGRNSIHTMTNALTGDFTFGDPDGGFDADGDEILKHREQEPVTESDFTDFISCRPVPKMTSSAPRKRKNRKNKKSRRQCRRNGHVPTQFTIRKSGPFMKKHLHNIAKDLDRVTDAASLKEVAREIVTKRRRYQAFESFFESHMDETGLSSDPTLRMMQINRQRRKLEDEFNQLQQSAA